MPHLLARLGPRTAPDRRVLHARGRDRDDVVSPAIAQLGEGRVVLLEGEAPPWVRAVPARLSAWPDDLHDLVRTGPPMKRGLDELWGARGLWALDPHGEPCELVWGREPDEVALLLNYSGWRFADLPPGPLAVTMARSTLGTAWILDPDAAPHPRHAVAVVEARERPVLRTSRIGAGLKSPVFVPHEEVASAPEPPPVRVGRPEATPVATVPTAQGGLFEPQETTGHGLTRGRHHFKFAEIDFLDGSIQIAALGLTHRTDLAQAAYQPLRDLFDEEIPAGVEVLVNRYPNGDVVPSVSGLDRLHGVFDIVERKRFEREIARPIWHIADTLVGILPGRRGQGTVEELIEHAALGLNVRADVIRKLYAMRDRAQKIYVRKQHFVFPIRGGNGELYRVWEPMVDDHATYIFQPPTEAALGELLNYIVDDTQPLHALYTTSSPLRDKFGFRHRVYHNLDDTSLPAWWRGVAAALGLSTDA